jgi:hypothetical protein
MPGSIRSMQLEHVLRNVQTDRSSLLHGRLLRWQFDPIEPTPAGIRTAGAGQHSPLSDAWSTGSSALKKRPLAGADHTLLQLSPVGTPAVIPARTNSATPANTTWAYEDSPFGQNADADYCQGIAKIDPYWVSDCS